MRLRGLTIALTLTSTLALALALALASAPPLTPGASARLPRRSDSRGLLGPRPGTLPSYHPSHHLASPPFDDLTAFVQALYPGSQHLLCLWLQTLRLDPFAMAMLPSYHPCHHLRPCASTPLRWDAARRHARSSRPASSRPTRLPSYHS